MSIEPEKTSIAISTESYINPTDFFKALSDPTRLKLVLILREQFQQKEHPSLCVCDLIEILQQPQPTVSRHLNHLKRIGILTSERKGTWMWYGINQDMPDWQKQVVAVIGKAETD